MRTGRQLHTGTNKLQAPDGALYSSRPTFPEAAVTVVTRCLFTDSKSADDDLSYLTGAAAEEASKQE
ncbi:hypothetical protein HBI81_039550 [Parastagonospora nodorum]|nr:hypothetical protein HBH67_153960 [Parastagonospora nodorum]KAH6252900.1 hypothetical protein HBI41_188980 [Parastagonospora nodorum]KAH6540309.1 hypothetical protein HBI81_039550 [Parastagonospora nodorum]